MLAVRRLPADSRGPSREAAREALYACLPPRPRDLLDRLLRLLHDPLPEHLRGRPLPFALDLHRRPCCGKLTRGASRGQGKRSAKKASAHATVALLSPEGRFTAGPLQPRQYMRLTTVLERLLAQAALAGLLISHLLLDQEFYSAEVIAWLQRHGVAFLVPASCTPRPRKWAGTSTAGRAGRGGATPGPARGRGGRGWW